MYSNGRSSSNANDQKEKATYTKKQASVSNTPDTKYLHISKTESNSRVDTRGHSKVEW